jgi:riboflavin biosynthesis pyrimidine reductase
MMRPYVICHMCTTIDGKILVDRWSHLPRGQSGGATKGALRFSKNEAVGGHVVLLVTRLVSVVDGGRDATSVFEIPGAKTHTAAAQLKVTKHRVLRGGIHWLRYRAES